MVRNTPGEAGKRSRGRPRLVLSGRGGGRGGRCAMPRRGAGSPRGWRCCEDGHWPVTAYVMTRVSCAAVSRNGDIDCFDCRPVTVTGCDSDGLGTEKYVLSQFPWRVIEIGRAGWKRDLLCTRPRSFLYTPRISGSHCGANSPAAQRFCHVVSHAEGHPVDCVRKNRRVGRLQRLRAL